MIIVSQNKKRTTESMELFIDMIKININKSETKQEIEKFIENKGERPKF